MKPRIALIAHDKKKDDMIALAAEYVDLLRLCTLSATGTTGDWWTVYANVPDMLDAMVDVMRTFRAPQRVVTAASAS